MTDKEIISIDVAIRHCYEVYYERDDMCKECREEHRQLAKWLEELKESRETINRQKAEIKRLKLRNGLLTSERELHKIGASKLVLKHRAEAIKGFAEMLKGEYIFALLKDGSVRKIIPNYAIDYVVKEMVGDAE